MTETTIAVLGLGTMGLGMAQNLAKAGYSVQAYNRGAAPREALAASSDARVFDNAADAVGGAEVILTCLANDDATRAVLLESEALTRSKSGSLLIDSGTSSVSLTGELHARCQALGLEFIDAPITGSKLGAQGGRLTFMVGGSPGTVARAQPYFEAMGRHVVHAGPRVGDGQRVKYCLNMTQAVVLQGVLEGYALARAQGLEPSALAEVFENSAGKTGVGSFKTPYLEAEDFSPHFRLDLMRKDLYLALTAARDHDQSVPLAHAVTALYDLAISRGWGAEDFLATAKLLDRA